MPRPRATDRQAGSGLARVTPMLATAGPVPSGPEWALELKWDGMRALVYVEGRSPSV